MIQDAQGLAVTTDVPQAVEAINEFIDQALTYDRRAEATILRAIEADGDCAIAHAYAAAYYLSQENWAGRVRAKSSIRRAVAGAERVSRREQLYIRGINAWGQGQIEQAIDYHVALVQDFPQDLLAVQQAQYHYFYQGDSQGLLEVALVALMAQPNHPLLCSMAAFGLEQCHQFSQAEALGQRATELRRHNPWAHHAVAHVLEAQGRHQEAVDWMTAYADTWGDCNSMLYTHNWWHVALAHLALGETTTVLRLYDSHVWGRAQKHTPKDQVGAIALLMRLELAGVEVGSRWRSLARPLQLRLAEHALPFQDLHYVYALARAGNIDAAYTMIETMVSHGHSLVGPAQNRWLKLAVPAARGLMAHAQADWESAIAHLTPVLPHLYRLGGSHTQQALFRQLYRHAIEQPERFTVQQALA
ncbi:tetratricopeptide repeat protein [Nodosilinea sp. LEGE 06152]|uniref:tetratricopeptide repeat protein n=1 Tax=Nodosilinea sp. LEGE 06152 TaxID=2777966 RepID=UPI00188169B1|nr:tetratricopeptide repeat protein [Nodosilinea sp. LEGE 06152]MBE9159555.1 tetratricopeptide repeat protein [Nodosilinea sp. LEGE 06152]